MKILRNPCLLFLALSVAGYGLSGCSSNSTSATTTNNSGGMPNNGSIFVVGSYQGGAPDQITYTVGASLMQHLPDSKTQMLVGVHSISTVDTQYVAFESNGDYSIFSPTWNQGSWSTLPFATPGSITTRADQGNGIVINSTAQSNGPGAKYSINGTQYATDSVTVKQVTTTTGITDTSITYEHYSFIPALGLLAIDRTDANASTFGGVDSLVSYSPK